MRASLVVIPTYNEAENIGSILDGLKSLDCDVLVIDDGSPDGTAQIVRNLGIEVIERKGKQGLGSAYREGFSLAIDRGYTYVIQMDADGSHRVADLIAMLDILQKLQSKRVMIMGTRWMLGGCVVNWPKYRQLLSKFGTKYAKLGLGIDLDDLTGGFRIYSSELLNALNLSDMKTTGYCFQIEMACAAYKSGAEVIQVPITFVERHHGRSKMTSGIALEAFGYVTMAGIKRIWSGLIHR